jgi:hypothetical protein
MGDHPQGDLTTFGYKPTIKLVENVLKSFYILATQD